MADDVTASPQVAQEQQGAADWPKPGDEGYVHPDGTPQSQRQLEDNRRAAADRAAAGSTVHGAPMATPGPQAMQQQEAAVKRAQEYSGPTVADAQQGVTEFVADKTAQAADEAAGSDQPRQAQPADEATRRTATTDKGKTTR